MLARLQITRKKIRIVVEEILKKKISKKLVKHRNIRENLRKFAKRFIENWKIDKKIWKIYTISKNIVLVFSSNLPSALLSPIIWMTQHVFVLVGHLIRMKKEIVIRRWLIMAFFSPNVINTRTTAMHVFSIRTIF